MIRRKADFALLLPLAAAFSLACGSSSPSSLASLDGLTSGGATSALGTAANFAVLAGTAVTCTDSTVTGDVGVYPGTAVAQTSCPVIGSIYAGGPAAAQGYDDFVTAYDEFALLPCDVTLTALEGQTLSPGVYCFDAAATSTGGVLTLDGPADGLWIFKIGVLGTGALTGTGFSVVTPDGSPPPCGNVYWWVAEAVTMTDSQFVGTILAGAAVTLTGGTFDGDAFAKTAVTITSAAVTACDATGGGTPVCREREDFVSGGGWLRETRSSSKRTFAVTGGIKHGAPRGHLTYVDGGRPGVKVKGTGVTAYVALDATTRRIEGTANVNGRPGFTYRVDVSDKGEPGRSDTFSILLSNGYSASGTLAGGNIQLHEGRAQGDVCQDDRDHDDRDDHDDDDDDCDDDDCDDDDDDDDDCDDDDCDEKHSRK